MKKIEELTLKVKRELAELLEEVLTLLKYPDEYLKINTKPARAGRL